MNEDAIRAKFLAAQHNSRTRAAYRRDLEIFDSYVKTLGIRHADVHRYHLIALADHLRRRGDRPATVDRRLSVVRSYLKAFGVTIEGSVRSGVPATPQPTIGLEEFARLIDAINRPELVLEGVASLLLVTRCTRVDDLVRLRTSDLSTRQDALTIDGGDYAMPRPLRGPLRQLARQSPRGLLLGGVTRQTITRRLRNHGEVVGVLDCTPQILRRSSDRILLETLDTADRKLNESSWRPQDRLEVVTAALARSNER